MVSSLRLMIHIMILSTCLGGMYGFECYSCNFDNSLPDYMPACNDPFDVSDPAISETVMPCDGGVCAKTTIINGNVTAVSRECLLDIKISDCDNECSTNDEEGTFCSHCCDTDRCNGAVSMTDDNGAAESMTFDNGAGSMTYDLLTSFFVFAFSFYWIIS